MKKADRFELKKGHFRANKGKIKGREAARKLGCSIRSIKRYECKYLKEGPESLKVMYNSFVKYGLPKEILSDKGSQFMANVKGGEANYQWYAHILGIELKYAGKARTKGKIEALFRFIQRDRRDPIN